MKDTSPPRTVAGSKEDTHWLYRESRAADAGAVRRLVRQRFLELAGVTILALGAVVCCRCVGILALPFVLQPFGRVVTAMRRQRALARGSQARPTEPWTWDVDAPAKGIERPFDRTRRGHRFLVAGLLLLAMTILMLASGAGSALNFIVVPGVPAALFLWLAYRDLRTGRVRLAWTTWPLRTGCRAELTLGVSDGGPRFERTVFRLRAIEEYPSRTHLVWCTWTEAQHVASDAAPGPGHDVFVAFDIPAEARGTRIDVREACWWELEVMGTSDAGPIGERFVVPIYDPPPPDVPPEP